MIEKGNITWSGRRSKDRQAGNVIVLDMYAVKSLFPTVMSVRLKRSNPAFDLSERKLLCLRHQI